MACSNRIVRLVRALRSPDLLHACLALLLADLGVRLLGVVPVWRVIRRQHRARGRQRRPADAAALERAVQRAARHSPYPMRCLPQSLALAWLLARRGVPTELRLGVRRAGGAVEAHAWLECDGRALDPAGGLRDGFLVLDHAAGGGTTQVR